MPVVGAVLALSPSAEQQATILTELARDGRLTVGELRGGRLAVVVETRSLEEERAYMDALRTMPGVLDVQVAWTDFSDLLPEGSH